MEASAHSAAPLAERWREVLRLNGPLDVFVADPFTGWAVLAGIMAYDFGVVVSVSVIL